MLHKEIEVLLENLQFGTVNGFHLRILMIEKKHLKIFNRMTLSIFRAARTFHIFLGVIAACPDVITVIET